MVSDKQKNKEKEERKYLEEFLSSKCGKLWVKNNKIDISSIQKFEDPDFLFTSNNGEIIGIEITKLIVHNENTLATQQLITLGNQVRAYIKKEYRKEISLIIDKIDQRIFSPKWADHLDAAYHPVFSILPNLQRLKDKIIEALSKRAHEIRYGNIIQEQIEIDGEYFKITLEEWINPFTNQYDTSVNNVQRCIENPINQLQTAIDKKNKKHKSYLENCSKCFLLVVIPDTREGTYCMFNRFSLKLHNFQAKFKSVILFDSNSKRTTYVK